jgi:Fe2+ or Zn2+ uptake regulation protein
LLLDQGFVCRVVLSDGSVCYRASHLAHHHHLSCISCGATEDVNLEDVEDVIEHLRGSTAYNVLSHRIEIYGLCPRCQRLQVAPDLLQAIK